MTPRYNVAVRNLGKLLMHSKPNLHPDDKEQLERDLFYLRLFEKVSLQKQKTAGGSP